MLRFRALGACLSLVTMTSTVAEYHDPSSEVRELLDRAKIQSSSTRRNPRNVNHRVSSAEEARAREILNKYYQLSAEALASNRKEAAVVPAEQPKKARKRKSASETFECFDSKSISGKFCMKYVIIGGGTAAWSAIDAILENDPERAKDILLITEEGAPPYNRTMLSKELWNQNEEIEYGYKNAEEGPVHIMFKTRADSLDVVKKEITLSNGYSLEYKKLLLATGGTPIDPSFVCENLVQEPVSEHVQVFRTIDDFKALKGSLEPNSSPVVVGGGFLGTELALAMTSICPNVTLLTSEPGLLYRVLPRYLSEFLSRKLESSGVTIKKSSMVMSAESCEGGVKLDLGGSSIETKKVVVAVGIKPEIELAQVSGLEIDDRNGGIAVNDLMMAEPDVFAAGDVASFHDRQLGRRRVEHWDHAVVTGSIAGKNMVGGRERYLLQSMFWSDLEKINTEFTAVGLVDSRLESIGVWNLESEAIQGAPSANDFTEGAVYYLRNGCVVGVVLWNPERNSGGLRRARALIEAGIHVKDMETHVLAGLVNLGASDHRVVIKAASVTPSK